MRYGLVAIAVLLAGTFSILHAEYVRFTYNPGVVKNQSVQPNPDGTIPAMPQAPIGGPRGRQMPYPGGQMPSRGTMGGDSSGAGPGSNAGPGPRNSPLPGDPNGGRGAAMPGPEGRGSGPGYGRQMDPNAMEELDLYAIHADAVVEVKKINFQTFAIEHKWGKTLMFKSTDIDVVRVMDNNKGFPTVRERFDEKYKELKKAKDVSAEKLLELAEWSLTHGLYEQFRDVMREFAKLKPEHASATAFKAVEKELGKESKDDTTLGSDNFNEFKPAKSEHYVLLYDAPGAGGEPEEIKDFLQKLELNYKAFFYWFALKGKYLAPPKERLVVVLADKPENYEALQVTFDARSLSTDGFNIRRDNIAVVPAIPRHEAYQSLVSATGDMWTIKGWDRDSVLKGERNKKKSDEENRYAQTIALILKLMVEESAYATVSNVGSVQLATATGLLPRAVASPEWIRFGNGSFFETPDGAYWPGTGALHWRYLPKFKIWQDGKKLDRPEEALHNVITDQYFRQAHLSKDPEALLKAETMSWALTYFLSQKKLDNLMRFYQELAALPRDLEFDTEVLSICFNRAFDLASADKPLEVNQEATRKLAAEWYQFIRETPIEIAEVMKVARDREERHRLKKESDEKDKEQQPGAPTPPAQPGVTPPPQPGVTPPPQPGVARPKT